MYIWYIAFNIRDFAVREEVALSGRLMPDGRNGAKQSAKTTEQAAFCLLSSSVKFTLETI